jgi:protein N-terminal methyltransferase
VDCPNALTYYKGSDTDGNEFTSIEKMWASQDLSTWYDRAKDWYEDSCLPTVDGVLGGIGYISDIDLEGSRNFLKKLKLPQVNNNSLSLACECGAGIGRVTKGLLLDFFDRCDLVESSSRLLSAAPDYIGGTLSSKCRFYCSELQNWEPGREKKYSIIWIQWVLIYLTDYDIVQFLRRCSDSLIEGGWIILKENTCSEEAFVVDVDDASITRSLEYWLDLILTTGLVVQDIVWQDDFPDEIYPVPIIALQRRQ